MAMLILTFEMICFLKRLDYYQGNKILYKKRMHLRWKKYYHHLYYYINITVIQNLWQDIVVKS